MANDSADVTSSGRSFHVCRSATGKSIRRRSECGDGASCLIVWDTYTKPDLPATFHERRIRASLAGNPGAFPSPGKK